MWIYPKVTSLVCAYSVCKCGYHWQPCTVLDSMHVDLRGRNVSAFICIPQAEAHTRIICYEHITHCGQLYRQTFRYATDDLHYTDKHI